MFDENSRKAKLIMTEFTVSLVNIGIEYDAYYKKPLDDIARRLLDEVKDFEPSGE